MEKLKQDEIGKRLKEKLNTSEGEFINWLTISDRIESIKNDVEHIRRHPLVSEDMSIRGYLVDTNTGKLTEVIKA